MAAFLTTQRKAELWLVVATLIWGATLTVIKIGLDDSSPLMFLCLRFLLSFLVLAAIQPFMFRKLDRDLLLRGLFLGVLMFAGYGFQTVGLKYTTVAKSSLITYCFVIVVPVLQYFLTGKPLKKSSIFGLLIVSAGMFVLNNPGNTTFNFGDFLTLMSAVAYALYIVGLDRLTEREPLLLTAVQFFVTAVVAFVAAFMFEDVYVHATSGLAFSLFFLAVPGGVVAIFLLNRFQRETTPTRASLLYSLEPVFAMVIGFVVLGSVLGGVEIGGAVIILAGVLFAELSNEAEPIEPPGTI